MTIPLSFPTTTGKGRGPEVWPLADSTGAGHVRVAGPLHAGGPGAGHGRLDSIVLLLSEGTSGPGRDASALELGYGPAARPQRRAGGAV